MKQTEFALGVVMFLGVMIYKSVKLGATELRNKIRRTPSDASA
jgi:hypothetical protein